MHIGITTRFNYGFFSNGLYQNIILLYEILESAGHDVFFIDFCGNQEESIIKTDIEQSFLNHKNIISYDELSPIKHHLDVVCTPGIACNPEHAEKYKSVNSECKIAAINYGNVLVTDICNYICSEENHGGWASEPSSLIHDAVLYSPHYDFCEDYLKINTSPNTFELPYIWDPKFIYGSAQVLNIQEKDLKYNIKEKNNIAIVEPNINFSKTFIPPLFTVKHLLVHYPDIFEKAIFFGTLKLINDEKDQLRSRILNDRVFRNHIKRMIFDPREAMPKIMSKDNPIFLSHQHLNALNYTYLEAAHFGYPLVHNSEFIKDFGYYYEDFNMIEAAEQLKLATEEHNDNLDIKLEQGKELCWKYSPNNPDNIKKTSQLFENI